MKEYKEVEEIMDDEESSTSIKYDSEELASSIWRHIWNNTDISISHIRVSYLHREQEIAISYRERGTSTLRVRNIPTPSLDINIWEETLAKVYRRFQQFSFSRNLEYRNEGTLYRSIRHEGRYYYC